MKSKVDGEKRLLKRSCISAFFEQGELKKFVMYKAAVKLLSAQFITIIVTMSAIAHLHRHSIYDEYGIKCVPLLYPLSIRFVLFGMVLGKMLVS